MASTNKTARNVTSSWLLLAINIVISFFMSPFVVNKLGSIYFGIWAVAQQFTGYLFLLDFGVRESVIRYTSKYVARKRPHQLNQILSTALIIYLPITLACAGLAVLCAWGIPHWFDLPETHIQETRLAILFIGLTIAQTFVFNVFTGILQGLNRFDVNNSVGLFFTFARTAAFIIALSLGYKLAALTLIQFLSAIINGMICAVIAYRLLREAGVNFSLKIPKRRRLFALSRNMFGYGFFVLINNIAQKINFASGSLVIGIFMPVASVTPFAIAESLVGYLRSLVISTAQIFSPLSSGLYAQRRHEELAALLIRGAKLTVVITLPIALTFAVLGDEFIGLWMGKEYMESAGAVLLVLGLMQIVSAPHYIVSSVLYGMSKHDTLGYLRMFEAAMNISLSIWLVQKLGIVGVALGAAISHSIVVLFFLPTLVARFLKLSIARFFTQSYLRALLAGIAFLLPALWVRNEFPAPNLLVFFIQIGVLCCIYLVAVYLLALDAEERQMMRKMITNRSLKAA